MVLKVLRKDQSIEFYEGYKFDIQRVQEESLVASSYHVWIWRDQPDNMGVPQEVFFDEAYLMEKGKTVDHIEQLAEARK